MISDFDRLSYSFGYNRKPSILNDNQSLFVSAD